MPENYRHLHLTKPRKPTQPAFSMVSEGAIEFGKRATPIRGNPQPFSPKTWVFLQIFHNLLVLSIEMLVLTLHLVNF